MTILSFACCHASWGSSPNKLQALPTTPRNSCIFLSLRRASYLGPGIRASLCGAVGGDGFYMRRCVELARTAVGCTSPNPMVGCVIVKDGVIVGEGFHPKAGLPHAEVFALRDAGDMAESATAYVSLEPCNHYGRTPPCTEALIRAKVKRVVVGMVDPNPIVSFKGVEKLRNSGIEVTVGVEELSCRRLNEAYIHKMLTGKPFVTLRCSLTNSGEILSNERRGTDERGGYYSKLMQESDGVIISSTSSLITSRRFPTSQEIGSKQPFQILILGSESSNHELPNLPVDVASRTVIILNSNTKIDQMTKNMLNHQGAEVLCLDRITFEALLDYCASQGMCSILLDLRKGDDCSWLVKEALDEKLVQKLVMEVSPSLSVVEEFFVLEGNTVYLKEIQTKTVNESTILEGYIS